VLVFPEGNRKDFDELADYLKEGLEVHFAKEYKDFYKVAFGKGGFRSDAIVILPAL